MLLLIKLLIFRIIEPTDEIILASTAIVLCNIIGIVQDSTIKITRIKYHKTSYIFLFSNNNNVDIIITTNKKYLAKKFQVKIDIEDNDREIIV